MLETSTFCDKHLMFASDRSIVVLFTKGSRGKKSPKLLMKQPAKTVLRLAWRFYFFFVTNYRNDSN